MKEVNLLYKVEACVCSSIILSCFYIVGGMDDTEEVDLCEFFLN